MITLPLILQTPLGDIDLVSKHTNVCARAGQQHLEKTVTFAHVTQHLHTYLGQGPYDRVTNSLCQHLMTSRVYTPWFSRAKVRSSWSCHLEGVCAPRATPYRGKPLVLPVMQSSWGRNSPSDGASQQDLSMKHEGVHFKGWFITRNLFYGESATKR